MEHHRCRAVLIIDVDYAVVVGNPGKIIKYSIKHE
jgi:hypothetical protein